VVAAVLGLGFQPQARAWQRPGHERMAQDAAIFLPPILGGMMRLYSEDLQRGVAEAGAYAAQVFGGASPVRGETVARVIEQEMQDVVVLIRSRQPFKAVFHRYGRLIGPVAELSVPLHYARGDAALLPQVREGFEKLSQAASPKFRILWGGYQDGLMRGLPASEYFLGTSRVAGELYPVLYSAFVVDGKVLPASSFDYRSIPFGVASISYSRSVNNIVNVWCAIWREAGGDMSGRQY
jgi:hypothetical protein